MFASVAGPGGVPSCATGKAFELFRAIKAGINQQQMECISLAIFGANAKVLDHRRINQDRRGRQSIQCQFLFRSRMMVD